VDGFLWGGEVWSSLFCSVEVCGSCVSKILTIVRFLRVSWLFGVSSDGPVVVEDIPGSVGCRDFVKFVLFQDVNPVGIFQFNWYVGLKHLCKSGVGTDLSS